MSRAGGLSTLPENLMKRISRDLENRNLVRLAAISKDARRVLWDSRVVATDRGAARALTGDTISLNAVALHAGFAAPHVAFVFHNPSEALRLLALDHIHSWHFRQAMQAFINLLTLNSSLRPHSYFCMGFQDSAVGRRILTLLHKFSSNENKDFVKALLPHIAPSTVSYSADAPVRRVHTPTHGTLTLAPLLRS